MKHLLTYKLFEAKVSGVQQLNDLDLALNVPAVGSKKFNYELKDNTVKILDQEFKPYELYDFVVTLEGELLIGKEHFKLAKKAGKIKAAGELKINELGKIIYLNNESGHYKPTKEHLRDIYNLFNKMQLTVPQTQVQYRY